MIKSINIAIDGPAGAGKSTIAKLVAKELDYGYVDTGAMYRTIALAFIEAGTDLDEENAIAVTCEKMAIDVKYEAGVQHMYLNGTDVSADIRREEVGNMASKVATKKTVRDSLLMLQRDLANKNNVIMDGRDIGTHVLPNADIKIYLTASVDVRAKRRYDELVEKGQTPDLDKIKADIEQRDYQDMNREIAPLKQAEDAIYLDTSDMTIEEVVKFICDKARKTSASE